MLERVWRKGNPLTLLVGMQTSTATMENSVEIPAIPLLGIHAEETRIERDTCTPMFIAALFIIARTWKQPRCPSADEWINRSSHSLLSPTHRDQEPWQLCCAILPVGGSGAFRCLLVPPGMMHNRSISPNPFPCTLTMERSNTLLK